METTYYLRTRRDGTPSLVIRKRSTANGLVIESYEPDSTWKFNVHCARYIMGEDLYTDSVTPEQADEFARILGERADGVARRATE